MFYCTLVRHGETPSNLAGIVQSRTGGELTAKGVDMAKLLGGHLQDETFTRIYSSDLQRCRETSKHLVSQLKTEVPEIQFTSSLRERDYGDWEFKDTQLVRDKMAEMGLPWYRNHRVEVPNGETYEEVRKRAGRFFSDICNIIDESDENQTENILVISHGIFLTCFIENLVLNPAVHEVCNFNEEQLNTRSGNTARTRFSISKLKPGDETKRVITFTHFFDVQHLNN